MDRLGIAFSGGANPAEIVDCVKLAETLGYESAWVAEGHGGDQFAILAACAAQTSKIQLGTSITSVFVRTAPTIAMAAATVDAISGGRFILGVGSSHRVQVEPEHGVGYSKPLTRVRETVSIIRALLHDGRVSHLGETISIERFDLWFTPLRPAIPIYISAVFPKMTALCGEIADGIMLTRSTLATAAQVRERLAEGAKRGGRDPTEILVTSLLPTAVCVTRKEALDALRPGLAVLCRLFSALQPHDGRAWLPRRGSSHCSSMVARRQRSSRACSQRCADRCDQSRRNGRAVPRADRSLSTLRDRPADPESVRPRPWREGHVRGCDPCVRAVGRSKA